MAPERSVDEKNGGERGDYAKRSGILDDLFPIHGLDFWIWFWKPKENLQNADLGRESGDNRRFGGIW